MSLELYQFVLRRIFLFFIVYLGILTYRASVVGDLSAGTVLGLFLAVDYLSSRILNILDSVGQFRQFSLYIEKLRSFLGLQVREESSPQALLDTVPPGREHDKWVLELQNVSFRYEKNQEDTLHDLNLSLRAGKKIAIVGRNGSGKSTLIKLIAGLYQPSQGEIYISGIPIQKMSKPLLRKMVHVIFQDVHVYSLPLLENISLYPGFQTEESRALEALVKSGLNFEPFPAGMQSVLTREFSEKGVELSGGERQKLILSRHYYSQTPVAILDEPLSSLDPLAEKRFCDELLKQENQSLNVLTSHRLACACLCSTIYYMQDGKITEHGTHEELMAMRGQYAELYHAQAEKFEMEEINA